MYLYHNTENDLVINVEHIHFRQQLIQTFKQRFSTYGYHEIVTPTFEAYDLYAGMNGTVNKNEMIKTIDNNGEVLVLRPDITIPITQLIANSNNKIHEDLRYFYIENVFRQRQEAVNYRESTQAGVEHFGNPNAQADAEIIALAIHLLQDMNLQHFKIEFGHAGFFKQLVKDMELSHDDLHALQQSIQAKNITDIKDILSSLLVDEDTKKIVTSLPFLYGETEQVLEKTMSLPLHPALKETLKDIRRIYDVLQAYGVTDHIVIDLSLINHMDYYSDMIFQGFIEKVGKPVVMGGRYNTLANQFNASIPAIGFAFNIDTLIDGIDRTSDANTPTIDVVLLYDDDVEERALMLAKNLRLEQFQVITYPNTSNKQQVPKATHILNVSNSNISLKLDDETIEGLSESAVMMQLKDWRA